MGLREQLQAIYEEHGTLTPRMVVDAARPKDHPLHSRFEWDNRAAGERWREYQASELIRSVKVAYVEGEPSSVRHFVSVRREDGHAYVPAEEVAKDEILTEIVLRDMEREWRQLHARYGHFKEFVEMVRGALRAA